MKLEGSIEEIKQFIKEFQPKDTAFTKQQLKQIEELAKKTREPIDTAIDPVEKRVREIYENTRKAISEKCHNC